MYEVRGLLETICLLYERRRKKTEMKRKPEKEIDHVLLTAHTEVVMVGTGTEGPTCRNGAKERP